MSDSMSLVEHVRRTEWPDQNADPDPHQHASRYGRIEQASGYQPVGSCAVGPGSLPGRQRAHLAGTTPPAPRRAEPGPRMPPRPSQWPRCHQAEVETE